MTTLLFSCVTQKTGATDNGKDNQNNQKINYLALGDSYTIGESVKIRERFPVQLAEKIEFLSKNDANNEDKTDRIFFEEPQIIAKTGWTCEELSDSHSSGRTKK